MSEVATRPVSGIDHQRREKNPLLHLPLEWRKPVAFFAAFHSDILKGVAGVVTRMRYWIKDDGLTLEEANGVMRKLMAPEKCAGFQYAGQLLAEMAFLVADAVRTRRELERMLRLRDDGDSAEREKVRAMLDNIGRPSTPTE